MTLPASGVTERLARLLPLPVDHRLSSPLRACLGPANRSTSSSSTRPTSASPSGDQFLDGNVHPHLESSAPRSLRQSTSFTQAHRMHFGPSECLDVQELWHSLHCDGAPSSHGSVLCSSHRTWYPRSEVIAQMYQLTLRTPSGLGLMGTSTFVFGRNSIHQRWLSLPLRKPRRA